MKSLITHSVFSLVILLILTTTIFGHESLLNVAPGWNMPSGYLRFAVFNSAYFKDELVRNPDEVKRVEAFRHFQSGVQVAYAFNSRLEVDYKQFLYQDHHLGNQLANLPGDGILKIKYAALEPLSSSFRFGFSLSSRLPFAKAHNAVMEPFSSDRIALALMGHLSYAPDRLLPESGFNMHFNLGYINFANTGEGVTNSLGQTVEALAPTQALQYGAAIILPSNSFTLSFELFGHTFTEQPPETAFGRESYLYFSPAFTFPLLTRFNLRIGADLRMSSNQNFEFTSEQDGLFTTYKLATYPSWRLTAGINLEFPLRNPSSGIEFIEPLPISGDSTRVHPGVSDSTAGEEPYFEEEATRRGRLKREFTQKELEKIKAERTERDRLLETLRKKLEASEKKDDPKKSEEKAPHNE
jgi:hypothetical protein